MKRTNFANKVLGGALVLFFAALAVKYHYPANFYAKLAYAVAEAAVVGGVADWFAVTALFRKPLGFPWHTELIPRNRERLIAAAAATVQNELLSKEAIFQSLKGIRFTALFISWMETRTGKALFVNLLARYIREKLETVNPRSVARYLEGLIKNHSRDFMMAPVLGRFAWWIVSSGRDEVFLDYILGELVKRVRKDTTRDTIYRYLVEYSLKETEPESVWDSIKNFGKKVLVATAQLFNGLNFEDAADALHRELIETAEELKKPQHPLRLWLKERLGEAVLELEERPEWAAAVEQWKKGVVDRVNLEEPLAIFIQAVVEKIRKSEILTAGYQGSFHEARALVMESPIMAWLLGQVGKYWQVFKTNQGLQDWVEQYLHQFIKSVLEREHRLVGSLVKDALSSLSDNDLNRLVEDKAGGDLQWIRVNGSVVGALVGLAVFLFLHLFYDPIVVPIVRSWL